MKQGTQPFLYFTDLESELSISAHSQEKVVIVEKFKKRGKKKKSMEHLELPF